MASSTYDLLLRAGDDYTFVVTWLPDGLSVDLSTATAEMTIAWPRYPATGTQIIAAGSVEFSTDDDTIVIDNAAHTVTVEMDDAITSAILSTESNYQLRVDIDGVKTTIASGRVVTQRNLIDG